MALASDVDQLRLRVPLWHVMIGMRSAYNSFYTGVPIVPSRVSAVSPGSKVSPRCHDKRRRQNHSFVHEREYKNDGHNFHTPKGMYSKMPRSAGFPRSTNVVCTFRIKRFLPSIRTISHTSESWLNETASKTGEMWIVVFVGELMSRTICRTVHMHIGGKFRNLYWLFHWEWQQ